jgi:uncharacterized protein (UPF0276 family)
MSKILSSVACNLDANLLAATLPLFAADEVEGIEWSFDTLYKTRNIPPWFTQLLTAFSSENRLVGHGVFFSLFSGKWSEEQENWLLQLKKKCEYFNFDHITEHFGFMTGENFHQGAPISLPFTSETLAIGHDRLKRIYNACERPVGLENLAFAYSLDEVKKHGEFLEKLIEPVNGFIILDLHNLYCHLHNFDCNFDEIILLYPLSRVREIHISGGSWEDSTAKTDRKIRRDTHNEPVPEEVFELLKDCIPLCPNLKFVVMEQLGTGLKTLESKTAFQQDFLRMKGIVKQNNTNDSLNTSNTFLPYNNSFHLSKPIENLSLYNQQLQLSDILESATDYKDAQLRLEKSDMKNTAWEVEKWDIGMLETAIAIAQKWKNGF